MDDEQVVDCSASYRDGLMAGILATIILLFVLWIIKCLVDTGSYVDVEDFSNKSEYGYYYDIEPYRFTSPKDREIGRDALLGYLKKQGQQYTREQISTLSDVAILDILEAEDDDEAQQKMAKLVLILDPQYKQAYLIVLEAERNSFRFKDGSERQLVYNLLFKYFAAKKEPLGAPLSAWSDVLLVRTFKYLKSPSAATFASTENRNIPVIVPTNASVDVLKLNPSDSNDLMRISDPLESMTRS